MVGDVLRCASSVRAWEVRGSIPAQADAIAEEYIWRSMANEWRGMRTILSMESFQLRQRNVELSPFGIAMAVEAILLRERPWLPSPLYATPSEAIGYATSARLKAWGLYGYGRGSAHKRDALRHFAHRAEKLVSAQSA